MAALQANCPACGAPVIFKSGSSVVLICEYCNSAIARTDRALEDLGKVAEIVESGSPLEVGMKGVYRGVAFELTGRAQLEHAAGGMWDEWYAAFADGRWGWLAEAQGRFYLTYRISSQVQVPPFDALRLGAIVPGVPVAVPVAVAEKGEARMLAAEGEIPYRLVPGEIYAYADLSGGGGTFVTIDYSENRPLVFVGREVTLNELGIVETARKTEREPRRVGAAQLKCPQCAGPMELRAPDHTERVTCPNCGSLLDINQGNLRFLAALNPANFPPKIPIGAVGELNGAKFTVIGFMVRSVEFDKRYYWEEYLLYNPGVGFRWLVQSDNHWSFVQPVAPGDVSDGNKVVKFRGKSFVVFQDAAARVEHVAGEFYWKVTVGETVRAIDFVRAPEMLSKEISGSGIIGPNRGPDKKKQRSFAQPQQTIEAQEINWSLGTYLPIKNVERAFKVENLQRPTTVAPNQPFPHWPIYKYWILLLIITFAVGFLMLIADARRKVFDQTYALQAPITSQRSGSIFGGASTQAASTLDGDDASQVIFTEPFELRARQNLSVTAKSNVDNNWVYIAGDLINEETGLVQQFDLPVEYYYGVEDGESWTEGGQSKDVYLSALPSGMYTMRLEAQWDNTKPPPTFTVEVYQGVSRGLNFLLALIAISFLPVIILIKHIRFEWRRWQDSSFNPFSN